MPVRPTYLHGRLYTANMKMSRFPPPKGRGGLSGAVFCVLKKMIHKNDKEGAK